MPSFALLYSSDELIDPSYTVKAIGYQWYWSYETRNILSLENSDVELNYAFDSYMVPTEDLEPGRLRMFEVDNRLILPTFTHIRVLVTSGDVLHN